MEGGRVKFSRGQASIALSLAIPVMVGAACIGADMWALYLSSTRLQQAADAAVLSGAVYLPANPALAQITAQSNAQMNGIHENEIVYNHSACDGRSITMVVQRNVPYRFARLFGLSESLVTVKSTAGTKLLRSAAGLLPIGIQHDEHYTAHQLHSGLQSDPDVTLANYATPIRAIRSLDSCLRKKIDN